MLVQENSRAPNPALESLLAQSQANSNNADNRNDAPADADNSSDAADAAPEGNNRGGAK